MIETGLLSNVSLALSSGSITNLQTKAHVPELLAITAEPFLERRPAMWVRHRPEQNVKAVIVRIRLGCVGPYLILMWKNQTPEELAAKRSYQARCRLVRAGAIPGLLELGSRKIRPDIQALIDEAIAKRNEARSRDLPA